MGRSTEAAGAGGTGAIRAVVLALALLAAGACAPTFRTHGYVPSAEELEGIVVGVDTRDSVAETLGRPSASGIMDSSGWYYVRSRWRHYGARAPQEVDREVVAIAFDDRGVVTNVTRLGLEDGQVVVLSRRVTGTSIREMSFLRQLYRNLGRFTASDVFR